MQFTMRTMLLTTACVAVALGGTAAAMNMFQPDPRVDNLVWSMLCAGGPVWVPVVILAYAAGKRRVTLSLLATFGLAEALTVWWFVSQFGI